MSIDLGSFIAGALIAAFSGGIGLAGSVAIFHFNRESHYLDRLADSYSQLFSQYRRLRTAVIERGDKMVVASEVYSAIYKIRIVDRDDSRVAKLEVIRGKTKAIAEHSQPWGFSTESDIRLQNDINTIQEMIENIVPGLREDIIRKRPLVDIFPE